MKTNTDCLIVDDKVYWLDEGLSFEEQGDLSPNQWVSKINVLVNDRTSFELVKLGFYSTAHAVEYLSPNWFG